MHRIRLANTKATVATPKTVTAISQLRLPALIEEAGSKGILLVVICLAAFAQETSAHAKLLAEKAHTELRKRFQNMNPLPVQLVSIELTEADGMARNYGVREVPYCLMFQNGNKTPVHSKKLSGRRFRSETHTWHVPGCCYVSQIRLIR